MDTHTQVCKIIKDYKEYWNTSNTHNPERMDLIYNYIITAHEKKYINIFN